MVSTASIFTLKILGPFRAIKVMPVHPMKAKRIERNMKENGNLGGFFWHFKRSFTISPMGKDHVFHLQRLARS